MATEPSTETNSLNLSWSAWKRFPLWLTGPALFRYFVLAVLVSSLLGDWIGAAISASQQDRIRYAGWLLEVFGLVSVAIGVNRRLDLFHGESLVSLLLRGFRSWIRQFPFISRNVTIHVAPAHIGITGLAGDLRAKVGLNPDATLERKVEFLLQRNDELTDQLYGLQDTVQRNKTDLEKELAEVRAANEKSIGEVVARTEDAAVGEIGWEFVGLVWIFIGLTFATIPEFIESGFGWLITWFKLLGAWLLSFI